MADRSNLARVEALDGELDALERELAAIAAPAGERTAIVPVRTGEHVRPSQPDLKVRIPRAANLPGAGDVSGNFGLLTELSEYEVGEMLEPFEPRLLEQSSKTRR